MVKVQKIAPYNFEFRKISVLSSQTDCYYTSIRFRIIHKQNYNHTKNSTFSTVFLHAMESLPLPKF